MALPVSQLPPIQPSLPAAPLTEAEKETLSSQMKTVQSAIDEFRQYLISKNMAANTVQVYSYALRQFLCRYHQADFSSLHLYKIFLLEHYKPQTVNLRLRALNAYLEFTREKSKKLPLVRIQQKNYLENVISEADYEYLKSCLLRDKRYLYYFLIRFMAATGARVSEVVQFQAEDIQKGFKEIYSKGNKTRRIYIPKALRTDALLWLQFTGIHRGDIFLNRFGRRITPAGIRGQLKTFAVSYGINPDVVHPHSFRHRFAKNFIEKCGDISLLSDLLGHKTIETTRIYLRRSSSEQYEIVNKVVDW
ncbi:MAG: tyrosine-type recombinase/integrase [Clostridium sp.]|nr:tyrosine-type recombinase/integrase [Clostridium sp.]